jgi:hypothetical protein
LISPARLPRHQLAAAAAACLLGVVASVLVPGRAEAQASWRLEQPAPPEGARFKVPLGRPDDIEFYAPNEGLLSVEGNAIVSPGLFFWNGRDWHQLSTVCGGSGEVSRIAWAGPDEFWVLSEPSEPRVGAGLGLCHFKDGVIVGSYSTPYQSPDPFHPMDAAACDGPDDCWFAGIASQDPTGQRVGAFHLHWDGTNLTTSYQPQGRGVTGLAYFDGSFFESTLVGTQPGNTTEPVTLGTPEPYGPILIHKLVGETFSDVDYLPHPTPGVGPEGTELLSAKADATELWFSGGGASSGPQAPPGGVVARPPVAVRYFGGFYYEVPLEGSPFTSEDRFVDVAPVPGAQEAWVADQPYSQRGSSTAKATVALIDASPGSEAADHHVAAIDTLPVSGAGRGSAQLVAATAPEEAWMVTSAGWIYHYTSGAALPEDADPYWAGTITQRPNESIEQFVSDTPPPDDSQLFAPPPVQVQTEGKAISHTRYEYPPLMKDVRVSRSGLTVIVRFRLTSLALVRLVAKRHGQLVAWTARRRLGAGPHSLSLALSRRRWPTALKFITKELVKPKPVPVSGEGEAGGEPTAVSTSVHRLAPPRGVSSTPQTAG